MKCEDVKRQVYLYSELPPEAKLVIDEHLAHCLSCRALRQRLLQQREFLGKLPAAAQPPHDAALLTGRIMAAIEPAASRRHGFLDSMAQAFDHWSVRYAAVVVSLCMVGFFMYEQYRMPLQNAGGGIAAIPKQVPGPRDRTLDSGAFYDILKNSRAPGASREKLVEFYNCITQCRAGDEPENCFACRTMYPKLYKKYENI